MGLDRKKRNRMLTAVAMAVTVFLTLALITERTGVRNENAATEAEALAEFAGSGRRIGREERGKLTQVVMQGAAKHGHNWITEAVRYARLPANAPWTRLVASIPPSEPVIDEENPVLMSRLTGILGLVAEACGNNPSDFSAHITAGRGVSAYSQADGSIYVSYMLAAGCTDDQIAFALAHEIRHLRACHYVIQGGITWTVNEPHAEAFEELSGMGYSFLTEPAQDMYSQELECDQYAAFIIGFCGYDIEEGLRLIDLIPEGDGVLYPSGEERKARLRSYVERISDESFARSYMPAFYLGKRIASLMDLTGGSREGDPAYSKLTESLGRDAAALDSLMIPKPGSFIDMEDFQGLFKVEPAARLEAFSPSAATVDVVLLVSSPGLSNMKPAAIVARTLMLRTDVGWDLAAAFDTPGRSARWLAWAAAEDKLPGSRPSDEGETRFAIDALSAWKASFVSDPSLHVMCYSRSGVAPYVENEGLSDRSLDVISLSVLFSSLRLKANIRIFDIWANRAGRGFVSIRFGYIIDVGNFPVLAGNCRLGMVPERGGWAVAGVTLY